MAAKDEAESPMGRVARSLPRPMMSRRSHMKRSLPYDQNDEGADL